MNRDSTKPQVPIPLMRMKDAHKTLEMVLGGAIAWCLPERQWDAALRRHASSVMRRHTDRMKDHIRLVETVYGNRFDPERRRDIVHDWEYHDSRSFLYRLREHAPYSSAPRIRVDGSSYIETALSGGRGVILWVGRFAYGSVMTKKGLASLGLDMHHLSRPSHAYTGSVYAHRVLSPVYLRAETRNLAERVVIGADRGVAALMTLRRLLGRNRIVSITVGRHAMQTVAIPLFDCRIRLATGAIDLALSCDTPLLPVFTIRDDAGAYHVTIKRPLNLAAGNNHRTRVRAAAHEYATRLAPYALNHPDQFDLSREALVKPWDP